MSKRDICLCLPLVLSLLAPTLASAATFTPEEFWRTKWQLTVAYQQYGYVSPAATEEHLVSKEDHPVSKKSKPVEFDWQYKERTEFSTQDTEYLIHMLNSGFLLEAPDVNDYVSRLLAQVHPGPLPAGHPGAMNVRVEIDATPNAYVLSNGTMVVTTGLLVNLRTDDELRGVLAHEIAHVYGDDRMQAKKAGDARAGLASAFTAFAGIFAGVAAGHSNDPSVQANAVAIGLGTAYAAGLLSSMSLEALGFDYNRKQEKQADAIAQEWLRRFGSDSLAFVRALRRLSEWGRIRGDDGKSGLMDTHPSTDSRLTALGMGPDRIGKELPELPSNPIYDAHIEKVISREAGIAFVRGRYNDAVALTSRAIDSGWPDANLLLVRASSMRLLASTTDSLRQAAHWLDLAEKGGCDHTLELIERAVLELRLEDEPSAARALDELLGLCKAEPCQRLEGTERWAADTRSQLKLRGR